MPSTRQHPAGQVADRLVVADRKREIKRAEPTLIMICVLRQWRDPAGA